MAMGSRCGIFPKHMVPVQRQDSRCEMSISAVLVLGIDCIGVIAFFAIALRCIPGLRDVVHEWKNRPIELFTAKLLFSETIFRVSKPIALVARVDRVYLKPSGMLVLVEFKSRVQKKAYFSDSIQMSVQRIVLAGQTGLAVAGYGYVLVKTPHGGNRYSAHRVELMSEHQVHSLNERRKAVLTGITAPSYPKGHPMCPTCDYRELCKLDV